MAKKFRDMVKLRSDPDVGDGNVIKELHRTIQFSDRALPGAKPVVDEEIREGTSEEPEIWGCSSVG